MNQKFYSNGKLLLTGEYVVLDGAEALAFPTRYGQSLLVEPFEKPKIVWKSLDKNGKVWFETNFSLDEIASNLTSTSLSDHASTSLSNHTSTSLSNHTSTSLSNHTSTELSDLISKKLLLILKEAKKLNSEFLNTTTGYKITTKLDFHRDWGLGSSSTLINNIANWAKVDAFKLLAQTFKGSGYDIAAAQYDNPILYSILNGESFSKEITISWEFTDSLFFVHLNKKQNSMEAIAHYYSKPKKYTALVNEISRLTLKIINSATLIEFEGLITEHEEIISKIIEQDSVKNKFFKDYSGSIKSLGAWGGDFILVTGDKMDMNYFRKKGFETIIPFDEMVR